MSGLLKSNKNYIRRLPACNNVTTTEWISVKFITLTKTCRRALILVKIIQIKRRFLFRPTYMLQEAQTMMYEPRPKI